MTLLSSSEDINPKTLNIFMIEKQQKKQKNMQVLNSILQKNPITSRITSSYQSGI
jgi:hypothetical protein